MVGDAPTSVDEIRLELNTQIAYIFERPTMFGCQGECGTEIIDSVLWFHCQMLAYLNGKGSKFKNIVFAAFAKTGCNEFGFTRGYQRLHPECTDDEVAQFVLSQWRAIVPRLQLGA
jgi:hypothetical protein